MDSDCLTWIPLPLMQANYLAPSKASKVHPWFPCFEPTEYVGSTSLLVCRHLFYTYKILLSKIAKYILQNTTVCHISAFSRRINSHYSPKLKLIAILF